MKKITTYLLFLVFFVSTANATNYYVDSVNGLDTNNGLGWGTALKTLSAVDAIIANHTANTDNVFIKGDVTITSSRQWNPKSQNYYFSCFGNETEPSQRELEDKDSNGIVEPWEFKYPTLLTYTLSSGYPINFVASSSAVIDGVVISNTGTSIAESNPAYISVVKWVAGTAVSPTTATFQSSIIRNCDLTYGDNTYPHSRSNYGCLLNVTDNGIVKNCLIEKNKISATSTNVIFVPVASLTLSSLYNSTPKVTNVVVRNNYATVTLASSATDNDRTQGMIFSVYGGSTGFPTGEGVFVNCLVYNNEISFSYPTGITTNTASLAGDGYGMFGKGTFRNCLFANNKLTNLASAMYFVRNGNYHYTVNNCVLWNNQNTVSGSITGVSIGTSGSLYATSTVSNNVMDVATTGTWGTTMTYNNNLTDLAQANTGTNAPYFSIPTTFTGTKGVVDGNDPSAITQSRWSLKEGSYLNGKGTAYSGISTDLAGNTFASTPSAGAYEYFGYYRSNGNGTWSSASTWQASKDNASWSANTLPPTSDVNSVVIQNGNTVTVAANATAPALTINGGGKLTINNGQTLNATSLTIDSDVTNGTGTIVDENTAPTISATINQYLPTGRNWYVGLPINSTTTPYTALTAAGATSVSHWDELNGARIDNYTGNLSRGKGYIAVSASGTATNNISFTGTLNAGDVTVPLTRTAGKTKEGFNLISNPYPSYLNAMTAINANSANMENSIWYRTKGTAYSFETVNTASGEGTNGVTGYIPPMQAFWVRATAASSSLTFTNAMRYHANPTIGETSITTTPLKVQKSSETQRIRLQLTNGTHTDEAVIYTHEDAANSFDKFDSRKWSNDNAAIPEIYTLIDNERLVINGLAKFETAKSVGLGFGVSSDKSYTLRVSEMIVREYVQPILQDHLMATEILLDDNSEYSFYVAPGENTSNRFTIVFRAPGISTDVNTQLSSEIKVFSPAKDIISITAAEDSRYTVYTIVGQKLLEGITNKTTTNLNLRNTNNWGSGVYLVRVYQNNKQFSTRILIN